MLLSDESRKCFDVSNGLGVNAFGVKIKVCFLTARFESEKITEAVKSCNDDSKAVYNK